MWAREAFPTLNLESHASQALTVDQWFTADATAVGSAGWEDFSGFPNIAVTNPENAWLMGCWLNSLVATPEGGQIFTRAAGAVASDRILAVWDAIEDLKWVGQVNSTSIVFPWPMPQTVPTTVGNPVDPANFDNTEYRIAIDPAAIGDSIRFWFHVRSAPRGVRVWGTW